MSSSKYNLSPAYDKEIFAHTIHRLRYGMLLSGAAAVVIAVAFWGVVAPWRVLLWAALGSAVTLAHALLLYRDIAWLEQLGTSVWGPDNRLWLMRISAGSAGLAWMFAILLLFVSNDIYQGMLLGVVVGTAAGGMIIYVYYPSAANIFLVLTLGAFLVYAPFSGWAYGPLLAALGAILFVVLCMGNRDLSALLRDNYRRRLESERVAQRAQDANYLYQQHWENTPLAVVQWNADFTVLSWSPGAEKMFGYGAAEMLGKHAGVLLAPDAKRDVRVLWGLIESHAGGYKQVNANLRKDGVEIVCEWFNTPIYRGGVLESVISFAENVTQRVEAQRTIQEYAGIDALTGLANRRRMLEEVERALVRSRRVGQYGAVVFIDLDHFKDINDTQGHHIGDLVLREFASRMRSAVRDNDMVARFGGDEFVVLCEDLGALEDGARYAASTITEKILDVGHHLEKIDGMNFEVDASAGIYLFQGDREDAGELLKKADLALYQAKNAGRRGYQIYAEAMGAEVQARVLMIQALRSALDNEEFVVLYQPIVDRHKHLVGVEALLRWQRPGVGLVEAKEFIGALTSMPLMHAVGLKILERVCKQIEVWTAAGVWRHSMVMYVNIGHRQLAEPGFAAAVKAVLSRNHVPPQALVFEIAEHSLVRNFDAAEVEINHLMALGLGFSLDDFGTGYSNLSAMQSLPIRSVKLGVDLIADLGKGARTDNVVRAIISLCHELSLQVVAAGVETEEQLTLLCAVDCDYFEGYLFGDATEAAKLGQQLVAEQSR